MLIAGQILAGNLMTNEIGWVFVPGAPATIRALQSPIPLQAAICDIIGTGMVADVAEVGDERIIRLEVGNYWIGDPGSNTLFVVSHTNPPVSASVPILFFINSYQLPDKATSRVDTHFLMAFNNEAFRMNDRRRNLPKLYSGERSWIPCVSENENVIAFASNLVVAAQINANRTAYYEIIRNGYACDFEPLRVRIDAEMSFFSSQHWMDTNMMWQAWDDPQLDARLKNFINSAFHSKTRSFFPRPPQFE
jgi:hypothetical protein